jgi:hypothetical protein
VKKVIEIPIFIAVEKLIDQMRNYGLLREVATPLS